MGFPISSFPLAVRAKDPYTVNGNDSRAPFTVSDYEAVQCGQVTDNSSGVDYGSQKIWLTPHSTCSGRPGLTRCDSEENVGDFTGSRESRPRRPPPRPTPSGPSMDGVYTEERGQASRGEVPYVQECTRTLRHCLRIASFCHRLACCGRWTNCWEVRDNWWRDGPTGDPHAPLAYNSQRHHRRCCYVVGSLDGASGRTYVDLEIENCICYRLNDYLIQRSEELKRE